MNSGHATEQVCVPVCTSGSSKIDFVLLELLTLVDSRNTTVWPKQAKDFGKRRKITIKETVSHTTWKINYERVLRGMLIHILLYLPSEFRVAIRYATNIFAEILTIR